MSFSNAKVLSTAPLANNDAKWAKLVMLTYTDPKNQERTFESAERTTRPEGYGIDAAGVIAILEKPTGPELILQKQYRAPVNKVTIEIPAGLVDPGETAERTAIRELKEETGYVGEVVAASSVMFNDPGFCNTNLQLFHAKIDESLPANQKLETNLEEDEFIEVFHVPLNNLYAECKRLEAEGCAIDTRVGMFAEGIECAKKFKLLGA